jgi:hypothetical protein
MQFEKLFLIIKNFLFALSVNVKYIPLNKTQRLIMWTCPDCGRSFKNKNQKHSCSVFDVADHFNKRPPLIKDIYNKLIDSVRPFAEFDIGAVRSAIFFRSGTTYIEIKPKKQCLSIYFYLDEKTDDTVIKSGLEISERRIVHTADLFKPDDVNKTLLAHLKRSYELICM